jgi:very-short-patch-repair endonuclease
MGGLVYCGCVVGWGRLGGALSRHQHERDCGGTVLSVVAARPRIAAPEIAGWAISRSIPVALIDPASFEEALGGVVRSLSMARLLQNSRRLVAEAAKRDVDALDASLAARSTRERAEWLEDLATARPEVRLAAWALTTFAEGRPLELPAAPLPAAEAVAALLPLAGPVALLIGVDDPAADHLLDCIRLGASLAARFPRLPVCIAADGPTIAQVLANAPSSAAVTMAREGLIQLAGGEPSSGEVRQGRSKAERRLHAALERDPRTRGRFQICASLPIQFSGRPAEVDLHDRDLALAVEIDGWHHFQNQDRYRRDRRKEVLLQKAGIFVVRFLEEDVWDRLEYLVEEVVDAVKFRAATFALSSKIRTR